MPDGDLLTAEQFAAKIKAKYPDYAHIPDQELTARILAKYPEYSQSVMAPGVAEARKKSQTPPAFDPDNPSRSPEDIEFAKSIGLKPTDIAGVTDAAMLGVGAGGVGRTIAKRGLKAVIPTLVKSTAGGTAGHYIGKMVGFPHVGEVVGSLAGGFLGAGEKLPTPEPEPFPPEATTTGRPSMTSPSGQTRLQQPPVSAKPTAPDPFGGMTSSGRPSMTSAAGQTPFTSTSPPPPEIPSAPRANGRAVTPKGSTILSRGSTLYLPGEEPDPSNPTHAKIINDLQTRSGTELRKMAANGDRFAAFILRNMPRPQP